VVLDALSLPPSSGQVNHIPQLQNPFHISSNRKEEPKNAVQVAQTRSVRLAASPFNDFYVVLRRVYKLAQEQSKSPSRIPPVSFINTRLGQKKKKIGARTSVRPAISEPGKADEGISLAYTQSTRILAEKRIHHLERTVGVTVLNPLLKNKTGLEYLAPEPNG